MSFLMSMTGPEHVFSKKLAQIVYEDSQADSSDNYYNDQWNQVDLADESDLQRKKVAESAALADERDLHRLMVSKSAGKATSLQLYYMFST